MTVQRCIAQHQQACFLLPSHVSLKVVLTLGMGVRGGEEGGETLEWMKSPWCACRQCLRQGRKVGGRKGVD